MNKETVSQVLSDSDNPIIIKLSISQFGNKVTDPTVTSEVKKERSLGDDSGEWKQNKIRPYRLDEVTSAFNHVRDVIKFVWVRNEDQTWRQSRVKRSPWDKGYSLAGATEGVELKTQIEKAEQEAFAVLDEHIVSKWPEIVEEAKEMHAGDFRPHLYPSKDAIRDCWKVKFAVQPVPSSSHLDARLQSLYGPAIDTMVSNKLKDAEQKVWDQIIQPLSKLAEVLADPERKFQGTMIDRLNEIIDVIPLINYDHNPDLVEALKELESFAKIPAQDLRDMPIMRKKTAEKAEAVAAKFAESKRTIKI